SQTVCNRAYLASTLTSSRDEDSNPPHPPTATAGNDLRAPQLSRLHAIRPSKTPILRKQEPVKLTHR
ncbi:hypothetical protein A2U01_0099479, partial [Trifolium medium]|nr:hypothetical protein [Trifolium medium]